MANEALKGLWELVERMEANALPPHKDCTNGWAAELRAELEKLAAVPGRVTEEQVQTTFSGICECGHGAGEHKEAFPSCHCGCPSYVDNHATPAASQEPAPSQPPATPGKEPPNCGCDEYPECTHMLYWYQGFKSGQAEARGPITHMREITGNPDIDGPIEGQKWVECDEGVCGAVAWRREKGEA
jgi:hypothetical protein